MIESWLNSKGGAEVTGFDILKSICRMGISAPNETSEKRITIILKITLITA
jgi:hypothetical protein